MPQQRLQTRKTLVQLQLSQTHSIRSHSHHSLRLIPKPDLPSEFKVHLQLPDTQG
jgi:hypothetical protein